MKIIPTLLECLIFHVWGKVPLLQGHACGEEMGYVPLILASSQFQNSKRKEFFFLFSFDYQFSWNFNVPFFNDHYKSN